MGRGHPLGLRTQGRGFDSRWVRKFFLNFNKKIRVYYPLIPDSGFTAFSALFHKYAGSFP